MDLIFMNSEMADMCFNYGFATDDAGDATFLLKSITIILYLTLE